MDKNQESLREWYAILFDVKGDGDGDGFAMELAQFWICTVTIVEHKDILPGLIVITVIGSTKPKVINPLRDSCSKVA
jgi:hypothetical protein